VTDPLKSPRKHRVTVIGTGNMGSALARAMLVAGNQVTVWNRTRSRTDPLRTVGAVVADSLPGAVEASDVVIMCIADQSACEVLLSDRSLTEALRGKVLVQLTTTTPADSRRNAAWADRLGIRYVDGAIMAYPRDIGTEDAVILICGPAASSADLQETLRALGSPRFVGNDAGRAQVVDAALIGFFYSTIVGYIHGATLATAEGLTIEEFIELSRPFFSGFITRAVTETGQRITSRRYDAPQSSMDTHLGGIEGLVLGSSRDAGIETGVVAAIRDSFVRAIAVGRGHEDIACLAEVIGSPKIPDEGATH
jgi:3-hydroxyisobutyrate dehydrogenase-like beta-hydroxyacid dehydrogenase